MGFSDLTSHVFSFCSFSSRADQFSCCSKIVSFIFFAAVLIASWAWRPEFHGGGGGGRNGSGPGEHLITSLLINGTDMNIVSYPQFTVCPLWPTGSISSIHCVESSDRNRSASSTALQSQIVMAGRFKDFPGWNCSTFNYNNFIPNADYRVWCNVNSTNFGNFTTDMPPTQWPGRIIVYVHEQGKLPDHCSDCYDGPNFGIVEAKTTGLIFWGVHMFESMAARAIEFRTNKNTLTIPTELQKYETSDMDFALGFFTKDIIVYRGLDGFAGAFGGERFGQFCTMVGGVAFLAYLLFLCLRGTLVLMFIGKDALDRTERQPII